MTRFTPRCAVLLVLAVMSAGSLQAAPVTFNFTFNASAVPPPLPPDKPTNGAPPYHGNATKAVQAAAGANVAGSITFESTLLANPGNNDFTLPSPAVLALQATVTGAASGNGTYTLSDFSEVRFSTGGATLNLAQQVVGQTTPGSPWGTPGGCGGPFSGPGDAGDFNLFPSNDAAPEGVDCFTIVSDGGDGDPASLTSFVLAAPAGTSVPVPALNPRMLAMLAGLLGLAAAMGLFRRARSR